MKALTRDHSGNLPPAEVSSGQAFRQYVYRPGSDNLLIKHRHHDLSCITLKADYARINGNFGQDDPRASRDFRLVSDHFSGGSIQLIGNRQASPS